MMLMVINSLPNNDTTSSKDKIVTWFPIPWDEILSPESLCENGGDPCPRRLRGRLE